MKNPLYWSGRAERRTKQYDRIAEETVQRVTEAYKKALNDIDGDIQRILGIYAKKGELSLDDAKTLLNVRETEDVLSSLRQKIGGIADPDLRREALSRINAPAYAHRISRMEALKDSIYANIKQLAGVEISEDSSAFVRVVKEVYNRHIFDVQQGIGLGFSFAQMDTRRTAEILRNAWSGEHYSTRIWANTDALAEQVQDVLLSGLQQGRNYRRMTDELAERMGAGNYYASRIIRTEAAAMASMADQAAYEECGTEKVRFLATLDTVTSEMCREMDGKVIPVEELEIGKNLPPLHPHCRSTTVEVFDDMDLSELQRRARDANGRPILVPADTTYEEWEKSLKVSRGRGIINHGSDTMGVDITIDELTPCLVESTTGRIVQTAFSVASQKELKNLKKQGWLFDWSDEALKQDEIYKLTVIGSEDIQGLIALKYEERSQAVYAHIAESAPVNRGAGKKYYGVGGHLFAIAAKKSFDKGYGGFVFLDAKNRELVSHYRDALGAVLLGMPHPYRMVVDEEAAVKLLEKYTL